MRRTFSILVVLLLSLVCLSVEPVNVGEYKVLDQYAVAEALACVPEADTLAEKEALARRIYSEAESEGVHAYELLRGYGFHPQGRHTSEEDYLAATIPM